MGAVAVGLAGLLSVAASGQQATGPGVAFGAKSRLPTPSSAPLTEAPEQNILEGRVVQAGPDRVALRGASGGDRSIFWVKGSTPVVFGGVRRSVHDLEPGMDVHAAYREAGGQKVAVELQLQPLAPGQQAYSRANP